MKHKNTVFSLLFSVPFFLYGQNNAPTPDSVSVFLNKSIEILKANAINRNLVNWEQLRAEILKKTAGAKTYEEAATVFPYIFQQIDDHHGALKIGNKQFSWNTGFKYSNQRVIAAVSTHTKVMVKLLDGNIGYILLPGNSDFSGKNINSDAEAIRAAIADINPQQIKGWILDLRVNTGGSMYQMLAGISELLGEGKLGSFVNQHGENDGNWIIRKGNIFLDSTQVSTLPNRNMASQKIKPLAIVISGMTASSGEVVAISTIGRKNTVLIGENSAGYTTANEGFKINKYAGLNLAVDYDADRNGKVYKNYITPNIVLAEGDDFVNTAKDLKVQSALNWIRKHK